MKRKLLKKVMLMVHVFFFVFFYSYIFFLHQNKPYKIKFEQKRNSK